jgi:hypothetical protein
MNFPFLDELNAAKSVLIVGAGGGYDVFCGLPLLIALKKAGKEVHLANISFGALNSCDGENPIAGLWKITQQTAATKYFPEMHLATWLARNFVEAPIYAIAPAGARPITAAFRWLCETLRFDTLILVDGGTDILMRGDEAGLATPEADAVSLFAGNELNEVARRFVACIGFGIDAHHGVCHAHFLENVATLSVENGYLGAWSLLNDSEEFKLYRDAYEYAFARLQQPSIVNSSIVSAISGNFGDFHSSTRTEGSTLFINPLMGLYWTFRLQNVARHNLYLDRLRNTETSNEVSLEIEKFRESLPIIRPWTAIPS